MKKLLLISLLSMTLTGSLLAQQENTIEESGNVGIGTTNPESKLDVRGSVKIDSTLSVKDSAVFEKNMTVQQNMRIEGDSRFNNVHILGTLKTEGLNEFNGPIKLNGIQESNSFLDGNFVFVDANGNATKTPYDSVEVILKDGIIQQAYAEKQCIEGDISHPTWANGLNKIYSPCPQVNVGIGTSTPRVKLDVRGVTYSTRLALNTDPEDLGSKSFHMKTPYPANSPTYGNAPIFLIENNERALFQINNDGIVRSREIKVNLEAAWPDYVFEPTYQLQSLTEVEEFIEENGHLPNVPSAEEIEEDGVSLAEMNRILLEKVEELTLHLIEQQKLLEEQAKRIESLETKND